MRTLSLSIITLFVFYSVRCSQAGGAVDNPTPAPQKPTVIVSGGADGRAVNPGEKAAIQNAGAEVWLDGDEISAATKFGINTLATADLAALDAAMTNVTGGAQSGYRFTPTPTKFKKQVLVVIPYNPSLLPDGMTAQDVKTYYYDTAAERWIALERVHLDTVAHVVVSATDHFTDMINATVVVPDHPQLQAFNPTQIKGIKAADPGSGINLIEPPQANNNGDARVNYPIEIPPGRHGMQPQLSINYNSGGGSGGNSWLGMGWDLSLPTISVDTRWGVPRYDGGLETETYTMNGEQLTPVAHRSPYVPRVTDRVFHSRVESQFKRIIRRGSSPANYVWEVTEKSGVKHFYGSCPSATLGDDAGNRFLWALCETRDTNGNSVKYTYEVVRHPGVAGGAAGKDIYPQTINYTGLGAAAGAYTVTFTRDQTRSDIRIDARGGFKRVTADRLTRIDITFNGQLVRRYVLDYNENAYGDGRSGTAFKKTLLTSISQFMANGSFFNKHTLAYYDDARNSGGNYKGFAPTTSWGAGSDNVSAGLLGQGSASAIGGSKSTTVGGSFYFGGGPNDFLFMSKELTAGFSVAYSSTKSETLLSMTDIDGDGLPDKVFKTDSGIFYRANLSNPLGRTGYGSPVRIHSLSSLGRDSVTQSTAGAQAYAGIAASFGVTNAVTQSDSYLADVNGDGLVDVVNSGTVYFSYVDNSGVHFTANSAETPVAIGGGAIDTANLLPNMAALEAQRAADFPLLDSVRQWVAPYTGTVRIDGGVQLIQDFSPERAQNTQADGVRVSIETADPASSHAAAQHVSLRIAANDYAPHSLSNVSAVAVNRGDRIFFRVSSVANGAFDQVAWVPVITYTRVENSAVDINQTDANNLSEYRFAAAHEFTMGGKAGSAKAPVTGTLHLGGQFIKSAATSDSVSLVLYRNGSEVFRQNFTDQQILTQGIAADIAVTQLDSLEWKIITDSRIDASKISFAPVAWYTAAGSLPVTDASGNFILTLTIPYDMDLYPVSNQTVAAPAHIVPPPSLNEPETRSMPAAVVLTFEGLESGEKHSGILVIKKRTGLLAKLPFTVTGTGATPTEDFPFIVSATATTGDAVFVEIASREINFTEKLKRVNAVFGARGISVAVNQRASDGLLGQNFRGWSYFGYNGSPPRDANPIDPRLLALTTSTDPSAMKVYGFTQEFSHAGSRWGIRDNRGWISATAMSSTRVGIDDIRMPVGAGFSGAGAPPRISSSQNFAGGAIGSVTSGTNKSLVDFQDLNGDRFPDVIGASGVQYTTATGGFEQDQRASLVGGSRYGSSTSIGVTLSTDTIKTIANGKGRTGPTGTSSSPGGSQKASSSLGFSGSLGSATSTAELDLIDINGDGLPDKVFADGTVALNLGYSFAAPEFWGSGVVNNSSTENKSIGGNLGFSLFTSSISGGLNLSQSQTTSKEAFIDINGDGLVDKVIAGPPLTVRLNTGAGFAPAIVWPGGHEQVAVDNNITLGGGGNYTYGFPCCAIVPVVKFSFSVGVDASTSMGRPENIFRDMDGDGYADHVHSTSDSDLRVATNPIGRTNMLKQITRPMGATIALEYTRDGNTYELPQSRWNLTTVTVFDGHPGEGADTQVTQYAYAEPHHDRLEREFFGYRSVSETHLDTAAGNAPYRQVLRSYITDSYYGKGLMRFEQMRDAAGRMFTETENTYSFVDIETGTPVETGLIPSLQSTTATIFPQLVRTDKRFYEGTNSAQKSTYTAHEYDALGNIVRFIDVGDNVSTDDIDAAIGYSACGLTDVAGQDNYIVEPIAITVRGGGQEMRKRESVLDCNTGDVTQVKQYLASGDIAVTDLAYEANGNLKEVTAPANKSAQRYKLTYTYDTPTQSQVTQIIDSFGLASTASYDFRFAKPTTTTDTNGQQTTYVYDAAGRAVSLVGPYEQALGQTTIAFSYNPDAAVPYALTQHIDKDAAGNLKSSGTIDTVLFIDGLKRVLQTKKDATVKTGNGQPKDVMVVSGQVKFDAFGRTVEQYYPVTENKGGGNTAFNTSFDTVAPTRTEYDVLDRSTKTTLPDNTITASSYGFGQDRSSLVMFETRVTDALGKVKFSYRDVKGLITSIKEQNAQQTIQTSYRYDAMKQITQVIDDKLNVTTVAYDNLGRRVAIDNPDAGLVDSVYDLAGNLIRKVPAALAAQNLAIEYDYDFNRLVKIRYPIFTANNVSYSYGNTEQAGNAKGNRAGRVTLVADASGTEERFYGPLGETIKEVKTLPRTLQGPSSNGTYTTEYLYDTWNRLMQMTYPDPSAGSGTGEILTYTYDSGGLVTSAAGKKGSLHYTYLAELDYDKFGQRVAMTLGNGVTTTYTYAADNRRLAQLQSQLPSPSKYQFQNLNYTYDAVGNITQLANATEPPSGKNKGGAVGGPSTQNFTYDDLYRLTVATGTYLNAAGATNTYALAMAYNSIHNIVSKNQANQILDKNGKTSTISPTTYALANVYESGRPHAASANGEYTMLYDANGNLIKRESVQNGQNRQLIWDEENRLACTRNNQQGYLPQTPDSCKAQGNSNAPTFTYDAAGVRVAKNGGALSLTINQNYSEKANKAYKHIFVGTQRLVTKLVGNNPKKLEDAQWYYSGDHLSSSSYVTNADGAIVEHLSYFPYGETWVQEKDSLPINYGFTAKELDEETGYYYFGARYYDPRVSTWISTDPAMGRYLPSAEQLSNSEKGFNPDADLPGFGGFFNSLNGNQYQYGGQNPLRFVDPDGRIIKAVRVSDQKAILSMVNSMAQGAFAFNAKGELYLKQETNSEGYSSNYTSALMEGIGSNNTIEVGIAQSVALKNTDTGKVEAKNLVKEGGITVGSVGGDQQVRVSGMPNSIINDKGKNVRVSAARVLMHELVGHAIPKATGNVNGRNAVTEENKVATQLSPKIMRQANPKDPAASQKGAGD